jgi:hypothetical protein
MLGRCQRECLSEEKTVACAGVGCKSWAESGRSGTESGRFGCRSTLAWWPRSTLVRRNRLPYLSRSVRPSLLVGVFLCLAWKRAGRGGGPLFGYGGVPEGLGRGFGGHSPPLHHSAPHVTVALPRHGKTRPFRPGRVLSRSLPGWTRPMWAAGSVRTPHPPLGGKVAQVRHVGF